MNNGQLAAHKNDRYRLLSGRADASPDSAIQARFSQPA
jgi:hypothetical protein